MGNNTSWSADDLKKKGLVQDANGNYVPVKSLMAQGKVDKLPNLLEKAAIHKVGDKFGQRMKTEVLGIKQDKGLITMTMSPLKENWIRLPNRQDEVIYPKFIFDMDPCPAPRMSRSDKWKTEPYHPDITKRQRPIVTKYFKFRDEFRELCMQRGFELDETIRVLFIIPFPESCTNKKMKNLIGQPHKQRPDCDNYLKSILDSFKVDDGYVWDGRTVKVWGDKGRIIIF